MTLGELIRNISTTDVVGGVGVEIKGVEIDSRRVSEGCLFVAMRGTQVDGHAFIGKAVGQGELHVPLGVEEQTFEIPPEGDGRRDRHHKDAHEFQHGDEGRQDEFNKLHQHEGPPCLRKGRSAASIARKRADEMAPVRKPVAMATSNRKGR